MKSKFSPEVALTDFKELLVRKDGWREKIFVWTGGKGGVGGFLCFCKIVNASKEKGRHWWRDICFEELKSAG